MTDADTPDGNTFTAALGRIVGRRHVRTGSAARPYLTGFRVGAGAAAEVVLPGSLVEMWRVLQACVAADRIVIMQAANTGLTGGSTPFGTYDRDVVVVSTRRLKGILPLRSGRQVVCLAGSSLHELESVLAPLGREPHSVIGSSCLGASVVGGVCNNSGGTLVRRGPAYTEYALFAHVGSQGKLVLSNHLGIDLGETPEEILGNLDAGRCGDERIVDDSRKASAASGYVDIVRNVEATTPSRYNADPACLHEASGSAGKVAVFAVRVDTFEKETGTGVFYIGTNNPADLTEIRQEMLRDAPSLPILGEYIHREAFDMADRYGKDTVAAIRVLGTRRLPVLFSLQNGLDGWLRRLGLHPGLSAARLMQLASRLLPDQLPERVRRFRQRFTHYLILQVASDSVGFTRQLLAGRYPGPDGDAFECAASEIQPIMLHRFAVAGAAVRYREIHPHDIEDIVALDVALPRNRTEWAQTLPAEVSEAIAGQLHYGHFFCHVFHLDYLVRKGSDPGRVKRRLLEHLDQQGAEYPAEHNVGHVYVAKPALAAHYRSLDPSNRFNPGIGGTSRRTHWQ